MTPKEFCKKLHGEEILYKLPWMSRPYHAVLLASVDEGVSVKPYYEDENERQDLIKDIMAGSSRDYEETKRYIDKPDFCFATFRFDGRLSPEAIEKRIKNGPTKADIAQAMFNPSCPFA